MICGIASRAAPAPPGERVAEQMADHMTDHMTDHRAGGFDDIVITTPTSIAYQRFSNESAHWWLLSALREMLGEAGLRPADIDGLTVSSFTLHPDSAVGFTQHAGLTLGWLEHLPMGALPV